MDQASQHQAGQERLSRAGRPKDARRALDEFFQVQHHRVLLLARVADHKAAFFFRFAENFGDIALAGQAHRGMVLRHGLDRQQARLGPQAELDFLQPAGVARAARLWAALQHQGRQDFQVGEQGLAMQQSRQLGWQTRLGLLVSEARVGRAKLQIGDQAIELPVAALGDHKRAFLDLLGRDGQPDTEIFL